MRLRVLVPLAIATGLGWVAHGMLNPSDHWVGFIYGADGSEDLHAVFETLDDCLRGMSYAIDATDTFECGRNCEVWAPPPAPGMIPTYLCEESVDQF